VTRRWYVGFVLEPTLAAARLQGEAKRWKDAPFRNNVHPCWTFKGAIRKARRWNALRTAVSQPGTFEVFGPLGKGDD
jgi:hypothetical protein